MKKIILLLLIASTAFSFDKTEVRLYISSNCQPCIRLLPQIDPILRDLVDKNKITLIETDMYFHQNEALVREDGIKSTPTCIIIKNGKKERYVGRDIVGALLTLN
jgi:thiol-disulfide isomerase/thioredoxin